MVGAREYYVKQNKSEKEKYHDFTHMWNLRNKTDGHTGREGKKKMKTEKEADPTRLLNIEKNLRVAGGDAGWEWGDYGGVE